MTRMLHIDRYLPALTRLAADRRGVTAIVTAIALTVLLGFAGLAIDVAYWLNATRGMQAAADQAAYAAASAAGHSGCTSTTAVPQAIAITAARGYGATGTPRTDDGTTTVSDAKTTVTVSCDTRTSHFTVKISQIQPMWFASLFMSTAPTASAFATAQLAGLVSDLCILALDGSNIAEGVTGTDANTATAGGSTTVNLGCGLAVDSNNAAGLNVYGAGQLTATDIYLAGDETDNGNLATSPTPNNILRHQTALADPYLDRHFTTPTACDFTGKVYSDSGHTTINPGVYCGGLSLGTNHNTHITLNPGVYYIVGGSLQMTSKVTVDQSSAVAGDGVTFVLTGNTLGYTDYATVSINGGANVSLTAPTPAVDPNFGGMVFFQDHHATASTVTNCGGGGIQNNLNGGANQFITGAVYFPNQAICFNGNSATTGPGKCTQLIARSFDFTGNSSVKLACAGTGVSPITVSVPQLIK